MPFKESLDFIQPIAVVAASVAVPLIVAYYGGQITVATKESENRVRYTELAISLLKAEPSSADTPLREWAISLLNAQAPVPLSAAAKARLLERALLSGNATLDSVSASGSIRGHVPGK